MEDPATGRYAQRHACDRIRPAASCEGSATSAKRVAVHTYCRSSSGPVHSSVPTRNAPQACRARSGPCVHTDEASVHIVWRVVHPPRIVSAFPHSHVCDRSI